MDGITGIILLTAILTAGLVAVVRLVTTTHLRRHLVERGLSAHEIQAILREPAAIGHGSLRSGLVLLAAGSAMIVLQYLPYDSRDPFVYGLVIAAAGVGFLLHQLLAGVLLRRDQEPVD